MFLNLVQNAYANVVVNGTPISAETLLSKIMYNIVSPIIFLLMAVAVVVFIWGVFGFIRNADSPEDRKKGGMHMLFGILGLFIMVTAYGILHLILGTINSV
jgi:hypothetical protein